MWCGQQAVVVLMQSYSSLAAALAPLALPLVVNTMGWIRGFGMELLSHAVWTIRPTFLLGLVKQPERPEPAPVSDGGSPQESPEAGSGGEGSGGTPARSPSTPAAHNSTPRGGGSGSARGAGKKRPDDRDEEALRALADECHASFMALVVGSGGSAQTKQPKGSRVLTAVELRTLAMLSYAHPQQPPHNFFCVKVAIT